MKIICLICALFCPMIVAATQPLHSIVVFGDSLSDNGNLYEFYNQQLPFSPPYFQGRFSNGPVWIELLASSYYPNDAKAHLLDYAFGGAGVIENDDSEDGFFSLHREMDTYFSTHDKADPNTLYVVWIGANNYLAVPEDYEQSLQEVTVGVQHGLQRLVDNGAKHILLVNLPNLGLTPVARNYDIVDQLTYLSKEHNIRLDNDIANYKAQYPDVQWLLLDVNVVFSDIFEHPELYHFTNTTDTCYEEVSELNKPLSALKIAANVKHKFLLGQNPCKGYVFFDQVHPTAELHQLMAEKTREILDNIGIKFE